MHIAWKILAGAAALVVVIMVGVAIAIATVDVDTLIGPVRTQVKAATGRELTVGGGARLKYSFEPQLVLNDISLANAPWGKAPALLSAKRLELQIALLPLLSRRFEVIELALVDPVIALETDADGRGNWEFGAVGAPDAAASKATQPVAAPAVANFSITGGTLSFRHAKSGNLTKVAINSLELRARDAQSPIAAKFSGKVDEVDVALEGSLGPLSSLMQQRWPFPVALKGKVEGRDAEISTKIGKQAETYLLSELDLRFDRSVVSGQLSVVTGGARPKLVFGLAATTLALADLPFAAAASSTPGAPPPAAARGGRLFSDTPVDFSALRIVDADGRVTVGKLQLADGRTISDVKLQLSLAGGRLDISSLSATAWGGTFAGSLVVDAAVAARPSMKLRVNGNGLDLGVLLAQFGSVREVRGGKLEVVADLTLHGASPRAWAASATGNIRAVSGRATLTNTKLDLASALDRLTEAVNPFRTRDPSTELLCAVVRLPFVNGVARVDRSVGIETNKLGVLASGTLDLRNETIDFAIQPKIRTGIPIDIPRLAELVRFSGPISAPEVKVDAMGSVAAIASVGAAVSTGGLSAVGQALFAKAADGGASPCQIALGQKASATATSSAMTSRPTGATNPIEDVGRAVGRLFGK